MTYTNEQAEKAIREKWASDLLKKYREMQHKDCVRDVLIYGLPYRVLWDYAERKGAFVRKPFEIVLLPFYPHPRYPGAKAQGRYDKWGFENEKQLKAWRKYFTRFILPYECYIEHWSSFDLFGNKEHGEDEVERFRAFLMRVLEEYRKAPGSVELEPYYKCLEDFDLYDLSGEWGGYMWSDSVYEGVNDDLKKHKDVLAIMERERELELVRIEERKQIAKKREGERAEWERSGKAIAPPIPCLEYRSDHCLNAMDKFIEEVKSEMLVSKQTYL